MAADKLPVPEEIFRQRMEKFTRHPFRSALDYFFQTGKVTGTLLLEVREMMNDYADPHVSHALEEAAKNARVRQSNKADNLFGVEVDTELIRNSYKIKRQ